MSNEIEFEIVARVDSIDKSLKQIEENTKKTGDKVDDSLGKGLEQRTSKSFKAIAVAAAAAAAAITAAFVVGLKRSIDAAKIQEDAVNDLNAALARTGQFSKEASQSMQDFASELQSVTTFGDEVILQNAALIQSLGNLSIEGLKGATTAAADLAAALRIDLTTASQLVGRAATGEIGTFSRYGVVIKSGATNAETFANALEAINRQFGGAAQAQVNTFSGAMTQLSNSFGDFQELIGEFVTKSPAMVAAITFVKEQFEALIESMKSLDDVGDPFESVMTGALDIARFFTSVLGPVVETIIGSFRFLGTLIGGVAASLVSLVQGNFTEAGQIIKMTMEESADIVVDTFSFGGTRSAVAFIDGFKEAISNAPPVTEDFKNSTLQSAQEIESTVNGITFDGFVEAWQSATNKIQITAQSLVGMLQQNLVGGIQNSFAAIGGALVNGENAFAAFGKSVLGAMGAMLVQFGSMLVTIGLGLSTVPFLFGLQGPAAVAAGLAAIVAGGALQALAGGGGGASAPSTGAPAGSTPQTPIESPLAGLNEIEDRGPQVSVTVQGNIMDRRETGLEIAEVIRESFGGNAVVFNT